MKKIVILFFVLSSYILSSTFDFVYDEVETKKDKEILTLIKTSKRLIELKEFLNDKFIFEYDIKVIFGQNDGPYFDSEKNTIAIPYSFIQETKDKFEKANYHKNENIDLDTASIDVLIHTIMHELGHAFVVMYDIPILGKEEDAVDNLANILLLDYFKNGDDILLTNADIFDLYDREKKSLEEYDFMDEHSLDLQRFYSMICFVYASNPSKYEEMLNSYSFPIHRKDMCIDELNNISSSWYRVLKDYMKN